MAVSGLEGIALVLGRVLFGGLLAFMGVNHFVDTEGMAQYAGHKGLPAPTASVFASGAVLVLGGLAIALGAYPAVGALAVGAFLVTSAFLMHDFWAVPDEQTQQEMTNFLKNLALAGGALAFVVLASEAWAYEIGLRLG